jgi:hypothetical protein
MEAVKDRALRSIALQTGQDRKRPGQSAMVMDLWERLHTLFDTEDDQQPEIIVGNLSTESMQAIVAYLLCNSREVQTALYSFFSDTRVMVRSTKEVIEKFSSGELSGGFLIEPVFDGYKLPLIGIFSDEPGHLSIDYEKGKHWTPVALISLFELFRTMHNIENTVTIRLSRRHFERKWQFRFAATLKEYLNEGLL